MDMISLSRVAAGRRRARTPRGLFSGGSRRRCPLGRAGVVLGAIGWVLLGGGRAEDSSGRGPLRVIVSTPPQAGIVERVGGARVTSLVLIQPGQDPHTFEPTPRQIMEIGAADAYLMIGMPFEDRLVKKLREGGSGLRFVDMAAGIQRRSFRPGEGDDHARDHAHDHVVAEQAADHGVGEHLDPHVWLAPACLERLAENAVRAFQELDAPGAAEYARQLEAFRAEIHAADGRIRELLAPLRGERFYVFHPAFGYFADAYGLEQIAAEIEGKEPGPRRLAGMIASARADSVRIIFVQPQFSTQAAAALANAIGGAVVPMDPLARDVLENLERVAREVHAALSH